MDAHISDVSAATHTVAFLGFWIFVAVVAIAGMVYDYRKKRLEMEALRTAIEHGQHLDPAILERLLAQHREPPHSPQEDMQPYLHIGGIITVAAGIGVGLAGLWIGLQFPVAKLPIFGVGVIGVCVGIGLLLSARALTRYKSPERPPGRVA